MISLLVLSVSVTLLIFLLSILGHVTSTSRRIRFVCEIMFLVSYLVFWVIAIIINW